MRVAMQASQASATAKWTLQQHFQKIEQNQIRASIKPQQIHRLQLDGLNIRAKKWSRQG